MISAKVSITEGRAEWKPAARRIWRIAGRRRELWSVLADMVRNWAVLSGCAANDGAV